MILGSLLDLGLPLEDLSVELSKLSLKNYRLSARRLVRSQIMATKFDVETSHEHTHRHYPDIAKIIKQSDLSDTVKEQASRIFYRLAEVEAKVHGSTVDEVHFHEIGAVDAIVDIVGACAGLEMLGIQRVYASALNVGHGFVETAHGTLPVPAPATAELLRGVPVYSNQVNGELVTPTGAAILTTVAHSFGELPRIRIEKIGYGAGSRDFTEAPNVLRVLHGQVDEGDAASSESSVLVIEANIDDMNPQIYGHLQERLLAMGVLDVFVAPVQMKKNRPGALLTVVVPKELIEAVSTVLFEETTTIGVRFHPAQRRTLVRGVEEIQSEFGKVNVKVSRLNGKIVNFSPEYEDCRKLAVEHKVPYKWIQSRVIQEFMNLHAKEIQ
jgi:uncharacterized protein (TIGR00299 family) protein